MLDDQRTTVRLMWYKQAIDRQRILPKVQTDLILSGLLGSLLSGLLGGLLLLLLLSLLLSHLLHNLLLLDQESTENAMRDRAEGTTTDRAGTCGRDYHRRHESQCAGSERACAEH